MKQPELGRKLAGYRNEKGLTQEQLAERTGINIRTIQRIESGEVTPRTYTLNIILEILGKDPEDLKDENESFVIERPEILKTAVTAGIILAITISFNVALVILRDIFGIRQVIHLNAIIFILNIVLIFFFNRGMIYLGKELNNSFLFITGITGILLTAFCDIFQIVRLYAPGGTVIMLAKTFIVINGINGIFYGVGLLFLKRYLHDLALFTGIMMICISTIDLIPVDFIQFIIAVLSVPCLLLQALILYRLQTQRPNAFAFS
jgi:transcriptional regulator with XRE-family HTH domain